MGPARAGVRDRVGGQGGGTGGRDVQVGGESGGHRAGGRGRGRRHKSGGPVVIPQRFEGDPVPAGSQRGLEYDQVSGRYAEFVESEVILPFADAHEEEIRAMLQDDGLIPG